MKRSLIFSIILSSLLQAQVVISNQEYVLSIHEAGRAAHMQIDSAEYSRWQSGTQTYGDRTNMTRRIYDNFNDVFDFIFIVNDEDSHPGGSYGTHFGIKNDTAGLGKSIFDWSANYGSAGQLQSMIRLSYWGTLSSGPSLHELCHRWGNSLSSIPTEVAGHWGYSSVGGQLGGWGTNTLVHLSNDVYVADGPQGYPYWGGNVNSGNSCPYSELELYLMGLIPSSDIVYDIQIAQDYSNIDGANGVFSASSFLNISITDITNIDGERIPAYGSVQTNFRILTLAVSDRSINGSRLSTFDQDISDFCLEGDNGSSLYNFWEATDGRATLKMDGLLDELYPGMEYLLISEAGNYDLCGYPGGPFGPSPAVYTLSNPGVSMVNWQSYLPFWLSAVPASGSLAGNSSIQISISPSAAADLLSTGSYSGDIIFENTANGISVSRETSLLIKTVATLPFSEPFEDPTLASYWTISGSGEYRAELTTNFSPHGGSQHLSLDDSIDGGLFSRSEVTLEINMFGASNAVLTFWVCDYGDEAHPPAFPSFVDNLDFDGVAISEDGTNWSVIQDLTGMADLTYTEFTIDLDAAIATHGMTYNSNFRIRFNQYDNWQNHGVSANSDGLCFDDISITADGLTNVNTNANIQSPPVSAGTDVFRIRPAVIEPTTGLVIIEGIPEGASAVQIYNLNGDMSIEQAVSAFYISDSGKRCGVIDDALYLLPGPGVYILQAKDKRIYFTISK